MSNMFATAARTSLRNTINRRALSTTATLRGSAAGPWSDPLPTDRPVHKYLIVAEDAASGSSTDSGKSSLQRRLSVRPQHLQEAKLGKASGRIALGGGLLSTDFADLATGQDPTQTLIGSVFVVQGENIEDVRHRLQQDVYFSAGVFDPSKVKIFPFLQASLGAENQQKEIITEESTTTKVRTTTDAENPSLSELREKEMGKWKVAAERTLGWLRDGGGRQTLA